MSKSIFLNRRLTIPLRLKLLDALVMPIVFYGSGSWPLLNARQFQHLSSVITKWQRQIAGDGFWKTTTITDAEFRARWRIPPLAVRLAKHRLLFLLQLHHHGPRIVWDVITAEDFLCRSTWFDALRHAFQWLSTMIPDFPVQEWTCEEILQWTHDAHAKMPNTIRRAVARYLTQEQTIHHVASMHRDIKQICQEHGVCFDDPPAATNDGLLHDVFACPTCSKRFSTIQGLTAHRWKQHGHISEERRFVYNGVCEGCRKCFWTAQRLQQHLRYSKGNPMGAFGGCLSIWIRLTNRRQLLCPTFFVANTASLVLLQQGLTPRQFLHVGVEYINMIGKFGKLNGASRDFRMNYPAVFVMQFMTLSLQLH